MNSDYPLLAIKNRCVYYSTFDTPLHACGHEYLYAVFTYYANCRNKITQNGPSKQSNTHGTVS